jgi:hypothetical protein
MPKSFPGGRTGNWRGFLDAPKTLTRIFAPLLPLVVIALVFGAAGYFLQDAGTRQIAPLAASHDAPQGARGKISSLNGDQLTLTTDEGASFTYTVAQDAPVEVLQPIGVDDLTLGDWINGGAIPHPQTVLALVNLIVVTNAVVP